MLDAHSCRSRRARSRATLVPIRPPVHTVHRVTQSRIAFEEGHKSLRCDHTFQLPVLGLADCRFASLSVKHGRPTSVTVLGRIIKSYGTSLEFLSTTSLKILIHNARAAWKKCWTLVDFSSQIPVPIDVKLYWLVGCSHTCKTVHFDPTNCDQ
jgi:hypothetical protein